MATIAARSLGRLAANRSFFFLCDMQEKFKPTIKYFPEIATVAQRLVRAKMLEYNDLSSIDIQVSAAKILEIPVIATEQYPKGIKLHCIPTYFWYVHKDEILGKSITMYRECPNMYSLC